jgi:hypothetical protein
MKFTKMHGLGNDYVYVDGFAETVADPERNRPPGGRPALRGRRGRADPDPPVRQADVRMRMFNADGSEGEMCGNGVRCVAKYAFDHKLTRNNPIRVETGGGVLAIDLQLDDRGKVQTATVNMGRPVLDLAAIPVDREKVVRGSREHEYRLSLAQGRMVDASFVSWGNPHANDLHAGREEARPGAGRAGAGAPPGVPPADERPLRPGPLAGRGHDADVGAGQRDHARVRHRRVGRLRERRADRPHRPQAARPPARRRPDARAGGRCDNCRVHDRPATEVFSGEWNG